MSSRVAWLLAVFVSLSPATSAAGGMLITKGPYIQSPTQRSITIMWECSGPDQGAIPDGRAVSFKPTDRVKGSVWYGEDENLGMEAGAEAEAVEVRYRGKPRGKAEGGATKTAFIFASHLKGLEPGLKYYYQVGTENGRSAVSSFRTIPEKADTFTFVAYTDSHGGKPAVHTRICDRIAKEKPHFVLHSGDFVDCGESYWQWGEAFFGPAARMIDHIPLWPSRGNHDGIGTWEAYEQLFSLPGKERYYSFDYGNAHLVSLDSFATRDEEMRKWCERDLASSTAMWKVVFLHLPAFGMGRYPCKWGWRTYLPMFEKHGVSLYLCGHLHIYQRLHPLYLPGSRPESAITYVINSGTGGKLRPPGAHPTVASAAMKAQYMVFQVAGATLTARAVDVEGKVIDRFRIERKRDGSYAEQFLASAMNARSLMVKEIFPKGYHVGLPSPETPSEVFFGINTVGLGLKEKIDLEVTLDEGSQEHYVLQPETIRATVDPRKPSPLKVRLLAKKGVNVTSDGKWFTPRIRVRFNYATSYIDGTAVRPVVITGKRWW